MRTGKSRLKTVVLIGVLAALVFALSSVRVGYFHFGNIVCLLSGLVFGPFIGGLAAGLGSMFYDFTNPAFLPEFWVTFIMKFAMGFMAGLLQVRLPARLPRLLRYITAGLAGQLLYLALFLSKEALRYHYVLLTPWAGVVPLLGAAAAGSVVNAVVAVAASVALAPPLRMALNSAGLFPTKTGRAHT